MTFEIVKRGATDFGGLVLPGVEMGADAHTGDLMKFTRERIRQRGVKELTTVYVAVPKIGWSAVIGYPCDDLARLEVGDVLVRVPGGYFARFAPDGDSSDPVEDVWIQVEVAVKDGRIERAYAEEIEISRPPNSVELYISLA